MEVSENSCTLQSPFDCESVMVLSFPYW